MTENKVQKTKLNPYFHVFLYIEAGLLSLFLLMIYSIIPNLTLLLQDIGKELPSFIRMLGYFVSFTRYVKIVVIISPVILFWLFIGYLQNPNNKNQHMRIEAYGKVVLPVMLSMTLFLFLFTLLLITGSVFHH